jgi:hypothetical protein
MGIPVDTMARIGYPKFGDPRVIPEPEPKFGYGLGLFLNSMGIFGLGTHKVQNFEFFGYYPWVPVRIGYPKFGHPRVIPEIDYVKNCSYNQKYKYY